METKETQLVKGFKGFDKNLKCRDYQFEIGKTFVHNGKVKACSSGFHFCENPIDVLHYYSAGNSRFCTTLVVGVFRLGLGGFEMACLEFCTF